MSLAPADLAVVGVFVVAILALGFSARLAENSVLQYLAAGRALSLPAFVATLVSTWYGGILGISESVSYFGLGTWLMLGVPYYVFAIVYALFLAPRVREEDQISIPERLGSRFGKGPALAGASLIYLLALPAAHVLMLGVMVRALTGLEILPATILATGVAMLFLLKGGLLADVRVSMLAFGGMYVGFAGILIWCLTRQDLGAVGARLGEAGLLSWTGNQGPIQILSFFILGAWTLVDPGFHQRAASARTPAIARKGVLVSAGFWCLFDILSISTAMFALALMAPLGEAATPLDRLAIFPLFGDQVLPPGLKGIFLCGILGTLTSAMVGYALVSGGTFGREIVARLRPNLPDSQVTRLVRVGIGLSCALAVAIGLSVESVLNLWYAWGGAVVGALLIPVWLAYRSARGISSTTVTLSIVLSAALSLGWMAYGLRTGNPFLEVEWFGQRFGLGTLAPGLFVSVLILLIGQIPAIIRGSRHDQR